VRFEVLTVMSVVKCRRVTIEGVGIGEWICCPHRTRNYNHNAVADYTFYISADAGSSQSAFTGRFLVTVLNNRDSSAFVVTPLPAG
jgi:hypothetical protein